MRARGAPESAGVLPRPLLADSRACLDPRQFAQHKDLRRWRVFSVGGGLARRARSASFGPATSLLGLARVSKRSDAVSIMAHFLLIPSPARGLLRSRGVALFAEACGRNRGDHRRPRPVRRPARRRARAAGPVVVQGLVDPLEPSMPAKITLK